MSALKKFFDKVKKDTKFKAAGEGRTLGSNSDRPSVQPGPSHLEAASATATKKAPTDQKAARAALARMEKRMGGLGKNTNLLQEVFTEMGYSKVQVESGTEAGPSSVPQATEKTNEAAEHPVLSVEGIFYKCPVIGPFVLTREDMEKKIHEFLREQYSVDPTIASAVMLATFNKDQEKLQLGRDTLHKYLENVLKNPDEEKYRKIRVGNRIFQEQVLPLEGAEKFLLAAGFQKIPMPFENREEDFYVLFPDEQTIERLSVMCEYLMQAEPILAELDRGIRVFRPSGSVAQFTLPDEFYVRTADEVQDEYKKRLENLEKTLSLRTKAMRERDEMKPSRKYRFSVLRIRMPGPDGGFILQGTFGAYEKISAVEEFVRENLVNEQLPFVLTTAVGNKLSNPEARLTELELVPAAILNFQSLLPSPPSGQGFNVTLLRDETLALVRSF